MYSKKSNPLHDIFVPLVLILLPCLAVLGPVELRNTGSNVILLLLVGLIAIISVFSVVCENTVRSNYYPLAIVAISISLSLHYVLISPYLLGWDVNREYFFFRIVSQSARWDPTRFDPYNSALSVTILPTILSSVLAIDGVLIFKVLYQLLFSLVPLMLYFAYREVIGARATFISTVFMMSYQSYYMELTSVTRQEIAEVFLACLILLLMKPQKRPRASMVLMVLLLLGLIVSHYSITYIFMFYVFAALILMHVFRARSRLTAPFVTTVIITGFAWCIYTAGGASFGAIVRIGDVVSTSMFTDFFDVSTRGPMVQSAFGVGVSQDLAHTIGRGIYYLVQLFIVVGVVKLLKRRRSGINVLLIAFSTVSILLLAASVIFPFLSEALNMSRIYQIALLFLAPACVLGGEALLDAVGRAWALMSHSSRKPWIMRNAKSEVAVVIVIFLLFNTGFVYETTGSFPSSISLSFARMKQTDNVALKAFFYSAYIPGENIASALWLYERVANTSDVCGDLISRYGVLSSYGEIYLSGVESHILFPGSVDRCAYAYLNYLNVVEHIGSGPDLFTQTWQIGEVSYLRNMNTIYSDGGSQVLAS
jgi:uncharacterized membrane protein